jgi:DNA polymerase-3 subunit epsilon
MIREIALDTETTGLDPYSGHRVVEIGCVEMVGHIATGKHFHTYLNPERDMPREAEAIHGLSSEFLKDKPSFRSIARAFLQFIGDSPLVIHNAAFDLKFLNAELERENLPLIEIARATDTVIIARQRFPGQPANLDALCKRFEIDLSRRTKHGALLDAELLADVYLELMGGRQATLTLMQEMQAEAEALVTSSIALEMPHRQFTASAEEKSAHRALLDKMKKPLWKELAEET